MKYFFSLSLNESTLLYASRGVGILLVVLAHIVAGPQNRYIYLFHMPLFFLLSGMAACKFSAWDLKSIAKRLIFLISPAVCAVLIVFLLARINPLCFDVEFFKFSGCARFVFGDGGFSGVFSAFWFIPSIAICYLLFFVTKKLPTPYLLVFLFLFVSLFFKYLVGLTYIPTLILSAIYGFQFFLVGYLISYRFVQRLEFWFVLMALVFFLVAFLFDLDLDLAARNYGVPVFSSLLGLVFSLFFVKIIQFISYSPGFLRSFSFFGQASLFILLYHQAIHLAVDYLFPELPVFIIFLISFFVPVMFFYILSGRSKYFRYLGVK